MNQIYNFEEYTSPVVTAWSLEQTRKRRAFEKQILLLSIAALLFEVCAVVSVIFLSGLSVWYGVSCAAVLCVLQICGGLVLAAFLKSRKPNEIIVRRLTL